MITENLPNLKIHKLSQEQYDRELSAGNIDENALYLTPDKDIDLSDYATKGDLSDYATKGDLSDYATKNELTELDDKVDSLTSPFILTEGVDYGTEYPTDAVEGQLFFMEEPEPADYIVETGTIDGWFYEKRNSGFVQCWSQHRQCDILENSYSYLTFPFTIYSYSVFPSACYYGNTSEQRQNSLNIISTPSSETGGSTGAAIYHRKNGGSMEGVSTLYINYYVVGMWK